MADESPQARALRNAATLANAKRRRAAAYTEPKRTAHEWWLDLVAKRLERHRST